MAFVQAQEFQLAGSGCSATATSIVITGFTLPDGTKLTQAMFGTKGFGTLEPGTSREESISFTGITDNADGTQTITGVTRGLKFQTPYTEDSNLKFKHAGSSIFVLSNTSAFYADQFLNTQDDQEVDGQITFNTEPLSGYGNPTDGAAFATKDYADGLGGATSYNRTVISGTAGATIAAGNIIYLDVADREWKLADADTAYSVDTQFGIAQGAGTDGVSITNGVLIAGKDQTQTGLTPGEGYYISTTAGALTATQPTNSVFVGIAESATVLIVDFQKDKQGLNVGFVSTSAGAGDAGKGVKLNASGVLDITLTTSPIIRSYTNSGSPHTWTRPAGLKYVIVEAQGAGGSGSDGASSGGGGGGGAYSRKLIAVASLGATETVTVGAGGAGSGNTSFGSLLTAANGANASGESAGAGGVASGGDINISGQDGQSAPSTGLQAGAGGGSVLGCGGAAGPLSTSGTVANNGHPGGGYGGGGGGAAAANDASPTGTGGAGAGGLVTVTEYYN